MAQTFAYCAGAKPPKEVLDKLAIPTAFANKKFYERTGKINSIKVKSCSKLHYRQSWVILIKLPVGTYSIILEEQVYKIKKDEYRKRNQQVEIKCLNEWWAKPYYVLKIKAITLQI